MPLKAKRGLLIANSRAGKQGVKGMLFPIIAGLAPEYTLTVHLTEYAGDATDTAAQAAGYDALFVSGGDGTLNGVASGLLKAGLDTPIGYFPTGTTNDLANSLGIPRDAEEGCKAILEGASIPHDMGNLAGEYNFLYTASFGAFTKVSYETPQALKNMFGHMAYVLNGAAEVFKLTPETVSVKWDSGSLESADVLFFGALNTHSMAGLIKIPPERADLADGLLELVIVKKPKTIGETNTLLMDIVTNNLYDGSNENIVFAHASHVEVHSAHPVAWTVDGEGTRELSDVTIDVIPGGVRFIR